MCPWPEYRQASRQRWQAAAMLQQKRAKGCLRGKCDTVAVYTGSRNVEVSEVIRWFVNRPGQDWHDRRDASYPVNLGLPVCLFVHSSTCFWSVASKSVSHITQLPAVLYHSRGSRQRHRTVCFAKLRTNRHVFWAYVWWEITREVLKCLVWQDPWGGRRILTETVDLLSCYSLIILCLFRTKCFFFTWWVMFVPLWLRYC